MTDEEQEDGKQDSYYAVLNVSKDASDEEIKRSYRHLAQVCHPDKIPDTVSPSGATSNFMRIQEAYEILSNEEKRNIYDIYGKEGLEAGLEVGEPLRSPNELKTEYEKFKAQQKAQREEASVAHRGVYSFKVDACEALNPYDRDVAHWPDLISVATTNSVQLPLSEDTQASLGCQVAVRKKVGGGSFICGLKRILTQQDTLECQAMIGLKSFVSALATRELGEFTTATVSSSWSPQAGLGLTLTTTRSMSQQTEAELSWQVGPESCMILGVSKQGQRYLIQGRLEAGASTGIVGKVVYQITESISLRASAKFGTMGVELELGGSRRISNFSTAGCSVVAGMQGIILRPKFSRGGHVFEVPVMLSQTVQDTHILATAYILPPLLAYVTKVWIVAPLRKKSKVKKMLAERRQRVREVEAALEEANAAALVLEPVAKRKLKKEVEKGGLVIVSAKYGSLEAIRAAEQEEASSSREEVDDSAPVSETEQQNGGTSDRFTPQLAGSEDDDSMAAALSEAVKTDRNKLPAAYIDVTTALRFQVKDSRLIFHKGISKSQMMGFCDAALGEDKVLVVHYLWQSAPYSYTIAERAAGVLPTNGQAPKSTEELALIRKLASRQDLPFDHNQ